MNNETYIQAVKVIKKLYGKNARFRQGQYEAIEATLTHHRTVIVQKNRLGVKVLCILFVQGS